MALDDGLTDRQTHPGALAGILGSEKRIEDSAAMLAEWGCDYLQGALIGLASLERPWDSAPVSPSRNAST